MHWLQRISLLLRSGIILAWNKLLTSWERLRPYVPALGAIGIFVVVSILWRLKQDWREYLAPLGAGLGALLSGVQALMTDNVHARVAAIVVASLFAGLVPWYTIANLNAEVRGLRRDREALRSEGEDIRIRYERFRNDVVSYVRDGNDTPRFLRKLRVVVGEEFTRRQFSYVHDVASIIIERLDTRDGTGLYFAGEAKRIMKIPDRGHPEFYKYLKIAASGADSSQGYFAERTAWVNHLLANDYYDQGRNSPSSRPDDYKTALQYVCDVYTHRRSGFDDREQKTATKVLEAILRDELGRLRHQAKECPVKPW